MISQANAQKGTEFFEARFSDIKRTIDYNQRKKQEAIEAINKSNERKEQYLEALKFLQDKLPSLKAKLQQLDNEKNIYLSKKANLESSLENNNSISEYVNLLKKLTKAKIELKRTHPDNSKKNPDSNTWDIIKERIKQIDKRITEMERQSPDLKENRDKFRTMIKQVTQLESRISELRKQVNDIRNIIKKSLDMEEKLKKLIEKENANIEKKNKQYKECQQRVEKLTIEVNNYARIRDLFKNLFSNEGALVKIGNVNYKIRIKDISKATKEERCVIRFEFTPESSNSFKMRIIECLKKDFLNAILKTVSQEVINNSREKDEDNTNNNNGENNNNDNTREE